MAYSERFPEETQEEVEESEVQGYVLHGDAEALRALNPELILDAVRAKLGELGVEPAVEVTPVADLSPLVEFAEQGEKERTPIPITRDDYLQFAADHGYTASRAQRSWLFTVFTSVSTNRRADDYPPLRWLVEVDHGYTQGSKAKDQKIADSGHTRFITEQHPRDGHTDIVDLNSIYDRLVASRLNPLAWARGSKAHVEFLTALVNERAAPEKPLSKANLPDV